MCVVLHMRRIKRNGINLDSLFNDLFKLPSTSSLIAPLLSHFAELSSRNASVPFIHLNTSKDIHPLISC